MTIKRVYVVTSGDYSDYGIETMFDNQENAEAAIDYLNKGRSWVYAQLEVWELNQYDMSPIKKGLLLFEFHAFSLDNIRVCRKGLGQSNVRWQRNMSMGQWVDEYYLMGEIWTKSEEHVLKIVSDKVAQILAMSLWGKDEALEMFWSDYD